MSFGRGKIILAVLQVLSLQSAPVTWRFVADELNRMGVINIGEFCIVRRAVTDLCRRGEVKRVQGFTGDPGQTYRQPIAKYLLIREGDDLPLDEKPYSLVDAMKTWNS